MWTVSKALAALSIVVFGLSPAVGFAACKQADLAGKWQAYIISGGVWTRCELAVSASGKIANTFCTKQDGFARRFSNGSVKLFRAPDCLFTVNYKFAGDDFKVVHATLSRDKLSGQGVGTALGGGGLFFSLIKL